MIASIEDIIASFLNPKPRIVCICGDFRPMERDADYCWTKCACGGWMSDERRLDNSVQADNT